MPWYPGSYSQAHRDLSRIRHWHPISLLTMEYIILAHALGGRIKLHLDPLIQPDLTGFMSDRSISQNIQNVIDIIQYTEDKKIPAVLIHIDFEKALDRVKHSVIYKVLEHYNFSHYFIDWVKLLNTDMKLCTVNAGNQSEYFIASWGTFQSSKISSYVFLLIIETFVHNISSNQKIKGIKIPSNDKNNLPSSPKYTNSGFY